MGDPRRRRKKYKGPMHPWRSVRIVAESEIKRDFGLKNKKEIWKASSELKRFSSQAKKLIRERGEPQAQKEEKQLLDRLFKLGLLEEGANLADVLTLEVKDLLARRLQSIIIKKKLAISSKQARQYITHGHIFVNGRKITVPSYLITLEEESTVEFNPISSIANLEHPERKKERAKNEIKELKEVPKEEVKEVHEFSKEELEKIEKERVAEVAE
jgi:small subunit ribosomal protein S4